MKTVSFIKKKIYLVVILSIGLFGLNLPTSAEQETTTTSTFASQSTGTTEGESAEKDTETSMSEKTTDESMSISQSDIIISSKTIEKPTLTLAQYKQKGATELAKMIRKKQVTSEELVNLAFEQIAKENPALNAVISLRKNEALEEAKTINVDSDKQPFLGVPILMKGLGHTVKGLPNTNGFRFASHQLARSDGSITRSLKELGFIVIGQTNFPELGLKNITDSALYGNAGSAWNAKYQAGGSSGGSGAAVASGMTPVASGSDAGGSIRIPASWNGIIGLKPSRGIVKGNGTSNTNQVVHFPLTKNMTDTIQLFQLLTKNPEATVSAITNSTIKNQKIAYTLKSPVGTPVSSDAKQAVLEAVTFLKAEGFDVQEVDWPIDGIELMKNYYVIGAGAAGIANFQLQQIEKRSLEITDVDLLTWALYQTNQLITKKDVNEVWESNYQIAQKMAEFHKQFPLLLTPTTASTAPLVDEDLLTEELKSQMRSIDTLKTKEERLQLIYDQWLPALTYSPFTQLANLIGQPAISLPTYVSNKGLPLGIQFSGPIGSDDLLLSMGQLFETKHRFKQVNSYSSLTEDTKHTEESSTTDSTSTMTETTSTTDTTATTDSINDTTETGDSNLVDNQSTINEVSSENKKTMLAERDNHKQQTQVSKNNSVLPKTNENTRLVIVYMIIGMTIVSSCSLFVFKKIRND
ncbi:hypothetical protein CBF34_01225 [Vagococcus penaei]|uniref:Uncharacterized protein n=1 Tax=Vagococcus penaei TaxID=633807 RepID=A0A1Q2D8C8_9ENTE|nr:amidase family protein [Vagococcus penaei]AQP54555.1 hypothetical protein BW732_10310 [Vagococcus penaei]RSU06734.1 hypothetical protein CBF34_01225 [Vagococcus penaei]